MMLLRRGIDLTVIALWLGHESTESLPVFNRSVTLRDSWAKIEKSQRD